MAGNFSFNKDCSSWKTERAVSLEDRLDCIAKSIAEAGSTRENKITALVAKFSDILSRDYGTRGNCPVTDLAIILAPVARNKGIGLTVKQLYEKDPLLASYVDELRGYKNAKRVGGIASALRGYLGDELAEYVKKYNFEKYVHVTSQAAV